MLEKRGALLVILGTEALAAMGTVAIFQAMKPSSVTMRDFIRASAPFILVA
jgi:hypothetical protein